MALEQEIVMDNAFYWPKHSDATALRWLDSVAQYLKIKITKIMK